VVEIEEVVNGSVKVHGRGFDKWKARSDSKKANSAHKARGQESFRINYFVTRIAMQGPSGII